MAPPLYFLSLILGIYISIRADLRNIIINDSPQRIQLSFSFYFHIPFCSRIHSGSYYILIRSGFQGSLGYVSFSDFCFCDLDSFSGLVRYIRLTPSGEICLIFLIHKSSLFFQFWRQTWFTHRWQLIVSQISLIYKNCLSICFCHTFIEETGPVWYLFHNFSRFGFC